MFCHKCGAGLATADAAFCSVCGAPVAQLPPPGSTNASAVDTAGELPGGTGARSQPAQPNEPPPTATGPKAGYYPDPIRPNERRYWNGQRWNAKSGDSSVSSALLDSKAAPPSAESIDTNYTRWGEEAVERPAKSANPAAPKTRKPRPWWQWVLIVAAILFVVVQVLVNGLRAFNSGASGSAVSCTQLADEAVRISAEQSKGTIRPMLLRVEAPTVVLDVQRGAQAPSSGELVTLQCGGTGYFSNNESAKVQLTLSLASDGSTWVAYEVR